MKIAFLLDDSLDYPDGVQQYILTLGQWYAQNNHEVHYIVSKTNRTDIPNIHSLTNNISVSFNGNTLRTPLPVSKRKIRAFFKDHAFDILHVQMPCSPFFAGKVILSAPQDVRIVGTFHIAPFGAVSNLLARLHRLSISKALKRFHALCSVSTVAQAFALEQFHTQTQVIPNAVAVDTYSEGRVSDRNKREACSIVFLGRLVERKGCIWLLRAIKELSKDATIRKQLHIKIGGRGSSEPSLRDYVQKHAIDDIVHFDGFIEEAEKAAYLAEAEIAVFPSISGESFGIILIEAMATGKPVVIAGDNPGYRTVMDNNPNHLCDPKNTNELADMLRTYITDRKIRHQEVQWQSKHVSQYDVRHVAPKILQSLYK